MNYIYKIIIISFIYFISQFIIFAQTKPIDSDNNGYYNISTLDELRWISENDSSWRWSFELDNDINAADTKNWNNGKGWSPIGNSSQKFFGVFNGKHNKIDSLYINRSNDNYIGFFGYIDNGIRVEISNLGITNAEITGNNYVGALAGYNTRLIQRNYSTGVINGNELVGGLLGYSRGFISQSYSQAEVNGNNRVGGLIGYLDADMLKKSYSSGKVTGNSDVGGLIGYSGNNDIFNSYWDTESSGQTDSDGGEGRTTAEMQTDTTFVNNGWNFDFIWEINSDYPHINIDFSQRPDDTDNDGYYNISDLSDLKWFSESGYDLDENFELDNDINAAETKNWNNGKGWKPVGSYELENTSKDFDLPFTGKFNGNGYKIDSLYINRNIAKKIGFIGILKGEVNNLRIENADFTSDWQGITGIIAAKSDSGKFDSCYTSGMVTSEYYNAGGIAGENEYGTISNSSSSADINNTSNHTGGLTGENIYGIIINSYFTGDISGGDETGGLAGNNEYGVIIDSYSEGNIEGVDEVGGLVGINNFSNDLFVYKFLHGATIINSYSNSYVSGIRKVGGIAGYNEGGIILNSYTLQKVSGNTSTGGIAGHNKRSYIANCYVTDTVEAASGVGGLVGHNEVGLVYNSYAVGFVNGADWSDAQGGLVGSQRQSIVINSFYNKTTTFQLSSEGGTGYGTPKMKDKDTYADNGWNFDAIWNIDPNENDGYPHLDNRTTEIPEGSEPTDTDNDGDRNITEFDELIWIMRNDSSWSWNFELDNDINAADSKDWSNISGWIPIGRDYANNYFTGKFNGNGNTIDSLYAINFYTGESGFFGSVSGKTSVIENIHITNSIVMGDVNVGGLIGRAENSLIKNTSADVLVYALSNAGGLIGLIDTSSVINSYSKGSVIGTKEEIGGFAGRINHGSVVNSYAEGDAKGLKHIGGFTGNNYRGIIMNSYATGNTIATDESVENWDAEYSGGFAGSNSGLIYNSYARGNASGEEYVGGFIGVNSNSVYNCYSTGIAAGDYHVGGLIGSSNDADKVKNSFWDMSSSFLNSSDGGTGKGYTAMREESTFTDAGWNFDFIWEIDTAYPYIEIDTSYSLTDLDNNGYLDIQNFEDLRWISESGFDFNNNLEIDTNIDASGSFSINGGIGFIPIGHPGREFAYDFKGNGYTIDSLFVNDSAKNYLGLFAYTEGDTSGISNINITNSYIKGDEYVGGLIGYTKEYSVINAKYNGKVYGFKYTGGLTGYADNSDISYSSSSDSVISTSFYTGGLIGYQINGNTEKSFSTADVISISSFAGGLIGKVENGNVTNSYARGEVNGHSNVGGFIGEIDIHYQNNLIKYNYSTGAVNPAGYYYGGLIGDKEAGNVSNSFWDTETSGYTFSDGGIGKTTSEMKSESTFTSNNWNFDDIWNIDGTSNDGYPFLLSSDDDNQQMVFLDLKILFENKFNNNYHSPAPVKIELRKGDSLMNSNIEYCLHGIVDSSGLLKADINNIENDDYWLLARTSGYFPVASINKITFNGNDISYDFTDSSESSVLGEFAMKEINDKWHIRAGDLNYDNLIGANDINTIVPNYGKMVSEIPSIIDTLIEERTSIEEKIVSISLLYKKLNNDNHKAIPAIIELYDGDNLIDADLICRKSAIVDTNGILEADFGEVSDGEYYIVIRANGYLPVATSNKQILSTSGITYDFTTSSDKSILGEFAMVEVNGVWQIRAGDLNNNGSIGPEDINSLVPNFGKNVSTGIPTE